MALAFISVSLVTFCNATPTDSSSCRLRPSSVYSAIQRFQRFQIEFHVPRIINDIRLYFAWSINNLAFKCIRDSLAVWIFSLTGLKSFNEIAPIGNLLSTVFRLFTDCSNSSSSIIEKFTKISCKQEIYIIHCTYIHKLFTTVCFWIQGDRFVFLKIQIY